MFGPIKQVLRDHTFGSDEDIKAAVLHGSSSSPWISLWVGSISQYIDGMPALASMGTILIAFTPSSRTS
jgi:hypothetical protein